MRPSLIGLFGLTTSTLTHLLGTYGYPLVALFVGIESSGIPFPGETMLITAAIYAGSGHLSIVWVIVAAACGAIVGDNTGYTVGRFGGRRLLTRYGRYLRVRPDHLDRAERFFQEHGNKTVFIGRFITVLRAWSALLAGTNRMPWRTFVLYDSAGAITWSTLYGLLGYTLGHNLPLLHRVIQALGIGGVVVAVIVAGVGLFVWRRRARHSEIPRL